MTKVVITGGPCAGKTTILFSLIEKYPEMLIIPEFASIIAQTGIPRRTKSDILLFNKLLFNILRNYEDNIFQAAEILGRDLICDRGVLDIYAYWTNGDFFSTNKTTLEYEYSRYDLVLYCSSLATDFPEQYNLYKKQNPLRIESVEQAIFYDERIRSIWSKHPGFYHISSNEEGVNEKLKTIISILEERKIIV